MSDSEKRHAARFRITPELIQEALKMPKNWRLRRVYENPHELEPHWWIMVEGDDLPEVFEGMMAQEIWPILERSIDDHGNVTISWTWDIADA